MRRLLPALSVALGVLVAGCGTNSGDPAGSSPTPTPAPATSTADPVAVVQMAMDRSLSATVAIDASVKVGGVSIKLSSKVDPAAEVLQVSGMAPQPIEARVIGDVAYVKTDSLKGTKPWVKVNLTKLRQGSPLRQSFDLETQVGIVGGIVSAEKVGDGRYRGTADLEKAAEVAGTDAGMRASFESSAKLAKDPKAIPFEATVDAEGRLTALSYTIATTSLGDLVTDVGMSGFGEPVSVTAPPASTTEEATEQMYAFL